MPGGDARFDDLAFKLSAVIANLPLNSAIISPVLLNFLLLSADSKGILSILIAIIDN
jgi:hypothetical protein